MPPAPVLVLGIETSCDETAASVVAWNGEGPGEIRSNIVRSQIADHAAFGGVVPEIAARAHVEALDPIIARAMAEAGVDFADLDAIAATAGPGLIGGLIVGLTTAKAIALASGKPLVAVNHLEGHALTARLTDGLAFPYLLLLVSGGHTQILLVRGVGEYERWGTTIDDALGEAFDKTAKLLGLPYPGGPAVERAAQTGDPLRFALPRPMIGRPGCDFSFSGLKTAIRHAAQAAAPLSDDDVADLCAAFEAAVTDVVGDRIGHALQQFRAAHPSIETPTLVVAGGVAANRALRQRLDVELTARGFRFLAPPMELCTDNGAMIAWAGAERLALGMTDGLDALARPRWPLDQVAAPRIGSGAKGAKA
ncbi:tRNA (adenosine(37)-N6)-threonylcarbamoyltransferase complex transferase subunit TsaD [Kaistia algarum]|uniref:tRNA (adenosine(37)-N6)-threonylcarbamoyltransferase complex transferase subunit TsaD n=1 Tax=Kaistia algarum TaxID=2083279 RepID=UPI000CE870C8|nr:tRNA (adenosine(37)-N6)-threonylcarbamoyltransferase complex transferase subunit TsaD [Kaistia algarum]MCX5514134.1 tRNA (adenosine(37)-N6)-threonylcarbamoyltransferase complex transferase subunit TsaD [Kaistia algarum]PPE77902.1 tRNA (adenosine(37)-N6)-threonylcarbamoyltransferase complex transferase subunit TsaD [Kaistia algarum]